MIPNSKEKKLWIDVIGEDLPTSETVYVAILCLRHQMRHLVHKRLQQCGAKFLFTTKKRSPNP